MAIIKCPECNKEISDQAPACIHCGYPLQNTATKPVTNKIVINRANDTNQLYRVEIVDFDYEGGVVKDLLELRSGCRSFLSDVCGMSMEKSASAVKDFPFLISDGLTKENANFISGHLSKLHYRTSIMLSHSNIKSQINETINRNKHKKTEVKQNNPNYSSQQQSYQNVPPNNLNQPGYKTSPPPKKRGCLYYVFIFCMACTILYFALGIYSMSTTNSKTDDANTISSTPKAESVGQKNEDTKKDESPQDKETKPDQKSTEEILQEYENEGHLITNIDADILYQYGAYYTGYAAHTAFVVKDTDGDSLKATTESNNSFSFSLVCNFEDEAEIESIEEGMLVELVGVIEEQSFGKTITLNSCHIINTGESVQNLVDTLAEGKEQQISDAESLKESIEAAAAEAEVQDREEYKASCVTVDYDDVARNPDNYKGQNIVVSGEVIQVSEGWFNSVVLRVDIGDNKAWYVTYYREDGESRILENDNVTLYGECTGVESYTSIMGNTVTVPGLSAKIVE